MSITCFFVISPLPSEDCSHINQNETDSVAHAVLASVAMAIAARLICSYGRFRIGGMNMSFENALY
jgi:hypothetical protein